MTTTTTTAPTEGPTYDKARPYTRAAWIEFRSGGITATEVRDWDSGSKRRQIITSKVTGDFADLSEVPAVAHGNVREPVIAAWIAERFGIAPCDAAFAAADNSRHIASPDGVTRDPFTGELVIGEEAVLSEIKTSKHDLTPGPVTGDTVPVLLRVEPGSVFDRSGYYRQVQWQMHVMGAAATLFVWEQHDGVIDPDTGTYTPLTEPQFVLIPRDEDMIARLVETADKALEEIDAARLGLAADLPPLSELGATEAMLVADLLAARDAEAVAKTAKDKAWKALQEFYLGQPDTSIDAGFAKVTTSTSTSYRSVVDKDALREAAPEVVTQYEALLAEYTHQEPVTSQKLTITRSK